MSAPTDELDADIARVAALRGRTVEDVRRSAAEQDLRARTIHASSVDDVFTIPADVDTRAEQELFDRLPPNSRRCLRELPLMSSTAKYADLLLRLRDEEVLIAAVLERAALQRGASWQPYGLDFPKRRRRG